MGKSYNSILFVFKDMKFFCVYQGSALTTAPPPTPRNPCAPNPCFNGGTCQATNSGSFMCICPPGFQGYCCESRKLFVE